MRRLLPFFWVFLVFIACKLINYSSQDDSRSSANLKLDKISNELHQERDAAVGSIEAVYLVEKFNLSKDFGRLPEKIQAAVSKFIKKEMSWLKKSAKSLKKEFPTTALVPYMLGGYITHWETKKYESVRLAYYVYSGGASGNRFARTFTIDKKTNEFISLDKIINIPINELTQKLYKIGIKTRPNENFSVHPSVIKSWNIYKKSDDSSCLLFTFDECSLTACAGGLQEIELCLDL